MSVDPDLPATRPAHLQARMVLLVAAGGAVGTAARAAAGLLLPDAAGVPVAVLAVNLVGAFVLGVLVEALLRRGPDEGRRRALRLGVGTGFCGGFTTYSSLAAGTAVLLLDGRSAVAIGYLAATLVLGGLATWAGVVLGARTAAP